ncbi:MAG: HU family DNA-binding protein [Candidatus Woesearchaeota archaeon]
MNKTEIVESMAKDAGISKADATRALDSFVKTVLKGAKKESVQLVGFGTFKMVEQKARSGVNPRTGEKIKIPARKSLKFKASKSPKY